MLHALNSDFLLRHVRVQHYWLVFIRRYTVAPEGANRHGSYGIPPPKSSKFNLRLAALHQTSILANSFFRASTRGRNELITLLTGLDHRSRSVVIGGFASTIGLDTYFLSQGSTAG